MYRHQNPELQRKDLLAAGCQKVFEEQISSLVNSTSDQSVTYRGFATLSYRPTATTTRFKSR
jgi:hypothetical protein